MRREGPKPVQRARGDSGAKTRSACAPLRAEEDGAIVASAAAVGGLSAAALSPSFVPPDPDAEAGISVSEGQHASLDRRKDTGGGGSPTL